MVRLVFISSTNLCYQWTYLDSHAPHPGQHP
jgi:hypothetical protein